MSNQKVNESILKMKQKEDPKVSAKRAVIVFRAIYPSPFVTMKFDWTIEDYNVDVSSGYESPPLQLYGKTVHFVLERHRNDDDGTYYDRLGIRSDFRMSVSGSVTVNDDAEITIAGDSIGNPPGESFDPPDELIGNPPDYSIENPPRKVICLVKKLRLVPKVRFLIDLKVDLLLCKEPVFAVQKEGVTEMDADKCRDNFVDHVRGLLQNPQFSDVTICTPDGKTIHAHKNILSARSPVFAAMFNHPTKEDVLGVVQVSDVPFDHLERLIGFMYGRMPDVDGFPKMADLCALYFACDRFQVLDLRLLVAQVMVSRMSLRVAAKMVDMFDRRADEDGISMVVDRCCIMFYEDVEKGDALKDMNPKYADMIMDKIREFR